MDESKKNKGAVDLGTEEIDTRLAGEYAAARPADLDDNRDVGELSGYLDKLRVLQDVYIKNSDYSVDEAGSLIINYSPEDAAAVDALEMKIGGIRNEESKGAELKDEQVGDSLPEGDTSVEILDELELAVLKDVDRLSTLAETISNEKKFGKMVASKRGLTQYKKEVQELIVKLGEGFNLENLLKKLQSELAETQQLLLEREQIGKYGGLSYKDARALLRTGTVVGEDLTLLQKRFTLKDNGQKNWEDSVSDLEEKKRRLEIRTATVRSLLEKKNDKLYAVKKIFGWL